MIQINNKTNKLEELNKSFLRSELTNKQKKKKCIYCNCTPGTGR